MMHGRLPWLEPESLDTESKTVYDAIASGERLRVGSFQMVDPAGRLEGPFNAMVVAPAVGGPLQALGVALRFHSSLSNRTREVAILTLAARRSSEFEWYAHERVGRSVGLTETELDSLKRMEPSPTFDSQENLVQRVVLRMLHDRRLSDQDHAVATECLGLRGLQELVVLVGYYDLLDLIMAAWETPLPAGVGLSFPTN